MIPGPDGRPLGTPTSSQATGGSGPIGASGNFGQTTLIQVPGKGILLILPSSILHTWTITLRNGTVLTLNGSTSPFVTRPFALDSDTFESIQIDVVDNTSQFIVLPKGAEVPFLTSPSGGRTYPPASETTQVTFTNTSSTQYIVYSPNPGTQWKVWGILGQIQNLDMTNSITITAVVVGIGLFFENEPTVPAGAMGFSKNETWTLLANKIAQFQVLPSGATEGLFPAAIALTDFLAVLVEEIEVPNPYCIILGITGSTSGASVNAGLSLQPLGIQELL